jgi:hypothetical protein
MSPVGQDLEAGEARGGVTEDHISLLLGFSEGERAEVCSGALALAPAVGYRSLIDLLGVPADPFAGASPVGLRGAFFR